MLFRPPSAAGSSLPLRQSTFFLPPSSSTSYYTTHFSHPPSSISTVDYPTSLHSHYPTLPTIDFFGTSIPLSSTMTYNPLPPWTFTSIPQFPPLPSVWQLCPPSHSTTPHLLSRHMNSDRETVENSG